jgi:hypothetical protein
MKAVLLSTQPKWVQKICHKIGEINGKPIYEKGGEVRKSIPILQPPFKVYIYETLGKKRKYRCRDLTALDDSEKTYFDYDGRGVVIGEFVCDKFYFWQKDIYDFNTITLEQLSELSCVSEDDLIKYANGSMLKLWHISDLVIYDKPRALYDFVNYDKHEVCLKKDCFSGDCWSCPNNAIMVRPPQSWCYVKAIPDYQS